MMQYRSLIGCLLLAAAAGMAQQIPQGLSGSWKGTLQTPAAPLDVIFNISQEGIVPAVKIDVPVQGLRGMAADEVTWSNDSLLVVEFGKLRARYIGSFRKKQAVIAGTWEQGESFLPLTLYPYSGAKRPQEPARPYPYNEEEVTFKNNKDGIELAGTFTWPKNKLNCPAVVLISGSGAQNRDEELLGHKPFLVLADALTKKGIAVLRFDDRGTARSGGTFSTATTFDFSKDAEAALQYLQTRRELDKKKLGLLGHSEGGFIAPMIAAGSADVAFVVLLAGPGLQGTELLLAQAACLSKASGLDDKRIEENEKLNRRVYAFAEQDTPAAKDSVTAILSDAGMPDAAIRSNLQMMRMPWFRYMLRLDPADYLSKTHCPVLALNGKLDLQVPYRENLEAIEKQLKRANNTHVTIKAYDQLNHLFQHCVSGLPDEYAGIEETMSPEVLADIGNWILSR